MIIRPLTTFEECRQVAALERLVWDYETAEDVVPPGVLIASVKRGGILLGAFDGAETLHGFAFSMPAVKNGALTQWSHMVGVLPAAHGRGIGRRLKLAQRECALRMGVELIEWTFDPLQAPNAHLNFARLGVVVEEYQENVYGDSSSPLHKGSPTDRFVAEWRLRAPHVERRISSPAMPVIRDSAVMAAVLVNRSTGEGESLAPGPATFRLDAPRLLVEIPAAFSAMQLRAPELAREWRFATRAIFEHYLPRYRVVDFLRGEDRGQYLLAIGT